MAISSGVWLLDGQADGAAQPRNARLPKSLLPAGPGAARLLSRRCPSRPGSGRSGPAGPAAGGAAPRHRCGSPRSSPPRSGAGRRDFGGHVFVVDDAPVVGGLVGCQRGQVGPVVEHGQLKIERGRHLRKRQADVAAAHNGELVAEAQLLAVAPRRRPAGSRRSRLAQSLRPLSSRLKPQRRWPGSAPGSRR